jgi:hypothetical protein
MKSFFLLLGAAGVLAILFMLFLGLSPSRSFTSQVWRNILIIGGFTLVFFGIAYLADD